MATPDDPGATAGPAYTERLRERETVWWKRVLNVRAPYRRHLRRLQLGRTLDLGCGIGRNLVDLPPGSVGIDHNPESVALATQRGCTAYVPEAFEAAGHGPFDSFLVAHVLEHMPAADNEPFLAGYLSHLRPGGRLVMITPQEAGFRSDPTHVDFIDDDALRRLVGILGLEHVRSYSFPFPRPVGRWFRHNEFVTIARMPETG